MDSPILIAVDYHSLYALLVLLDRVLEVFSESLEFIFH